MLGGIVTPGALSTAAALLIAAAFACWCRGALQGMVFGCQILAYGLMAWSSWLIGVYAAVFGFGMCAIMLLLRALRLYPGRVVLNLTPIAVFAGCLIVNNRGWLGLPVACAALLTVNMQFYQSRIEFRRGPDPLTLRPRKPVYTYLCTVDEMRRERAYVFDLILENIVCVLLWGVYAHLVNDTPMRVLRGAQLAVNTADLLYRMRYILIDLIPVPRRLQYKRPPMGKRERNWRI